VVLLNDESGRVFERFTNLARNSVVLAQDEARQLRHNYIGTEHILLGLMRQSDSLAAETLAGLGLSLEQVRLEVIAVVGHGKQEPSGHIPFTPRAKKTLELALREALSLQHNYIGTEHILLGLVREGDGVAAKVLVKVGGDLDRIREAVLQRLSRLPPEPGGTPSGPRGLRRWLRGRAGSSAVEGVGPLGAFGFRPEGWSTTPAADAGLEAARRFAAGGPIGSHHLMLASLAAPDGAAVKTLSALGVDLEAVQTALRSADVTGTADELPADRGRRTMTVALAEDELVLRVTDTRVLDEARRVFSALRDRTGEPNVLSGGLPEAGSLADVWEALVESLQQIYRAAAGED
jgi:hypothetical protein